MSKTAAVAIEVRWRDAATSGAWSAPRSFAVADTITVPNLQRGVAYAFQARSVSACGAKSAWVGKNYTVDAAVPPGTNVNGNGVADGVKLWWGDGTGGRIDLQYEIQRASAAEPWDAMPPPDGNGAWVQVAIVSGASWVDPVGDTALYWYRVRALSPDGGKGPWAMLNASMAATISTTELDAKVTQDLQDLTDAQTTLDSHVTALQTQVDGIIVGDVANAKQWVSTSTYDLGEMVYDGGKLYRAKQAVPAGTLLTDTTYWEIVGDYTTLKASLDGKAEASAVTALTTRVTNNESVITSTSQSLALLGAKNGASTAFVLNQNTVQIGGGTTFASMLSGLQASDGNLSARIDTEQTARVSGDSANASNITSLQARMPGGTGTLATKASVDSEVTARADGDSANASSITSLTATVNDPTTGLAATASVATQAKATADNASGKVNASYTLRVDGGGRVSGFIAQSNGVASDFTVVADKFSIVSPTGGARTEYSAGQWRVYDSAGVLRVKMGVL